MGGTPTRARQRPLAGSPRRPARCISFPTALRPAVMPRPVRSLVVAATIRRCRARRRVPRPRWSGRKQALRPSSVRSLSKKGISRRRAERGGFEPPSDRRPETVFESRRFSHETPAQGDIYFAVGDIPRARPTAWGWRGAGATAILRAPRGVQRRERPLRRPRVFSVAARRGVRSLARGLDLLLVLIRPATKPLEQQARGQPEDRRDDEPGGVGLQRVDVCELWGAAA